MSLYPEDDKEQTNVNQINSEFLQHQEDKKKSNVMPGWKPPSENPLDKEEQEAARKKQVLQGMIQEEIDKVKNELNMQLQQIPTIIQQTIQQMAVQQPQPPNAPQGGMPGINDLPPEMKADMLSKVGTSLAQIIQAWKGSQGTAPQVDPFGEMFKQLGINIMQAGVDGIYKQVYDGYQPQPRPNPLNTPQPQPQPNNQKMDGFR